MLHTKIDGSGLVGNLLGDPTERDLFVYLPPGYEEGDERYATALAFAALAPAIGSACEYNDATSASARRPASAVP